MALRLGEIVQALGGELQGDEAFEVRRLAPLATAGPDALSFLSHPKYRKELAASRAACVIVSPAMREAAAERGSFIVTDDPYLYFARLTQLWKARHAREDGPRIHPSAVIDPAAQVDATARVGALCVVERGARIGPGTVLKSRVTLSEDCVVGARCLLHPGVVIGADGFGLAPHQGAWVKIEQLGAVRIGDDVEIGANTCIDRGALEDTTLDEDVRVDNLVQIAHNVQIGAHSAIAGSTGIAGSAKIGRYCLLGGAVGVVGHLEICDHVVITGKSVVRNSITEPGEYSSGTPLTDNRTWRKNAARFKQLDSLARRILAVSKEKE